MQEHGTTKANAIVHGEEIPAILQVKIVEGEAGKIPCRRCYDRVPSAADNIVPNASAVVQITPLQGIDRIVGRDRQSVGASWRGWLRGW